MSRFATGAARLVAVGVLSAMTAGAAYAQDYPSRSIEIVNPYPPGGTTDGLTRALAPGMAERLGQSVVVVNQPGAAGTVGAQAVAASNPDGYKLIFMPALTISVLPKTNETGYGTDAFIPICQTFSNVMAVVAAPDSPFNSVKEVVEKAKAEPGSVDFGHQGISSIPHLAMVEFAETAGIELLDIPYPGEPQVLVDLLGGRVDLAAVVLGGVAGRDVKVLGIFADQRHPAFPDVPTVPEQGFDVAPASFGGLFAPAGTPDAVIAKLSDACEGAAMDQLYADAAKNAFQPTEYFADAAAFDERLRQDIADKERLLNKINSKN